jgi:hypothetical protein
VRWKELSLDQKPHSSGRIDLDQTWRSGCFEQDFPLMGWSGRAPAPPAIEALNEAPAAQRGPPMRQRRWTVPRAGPPRRNAPAASAAATCGGTARRPKALNDRRASVTARWSRNGRLATTRSAAAIQDPSAGPLATMILPNLVRRRIKGGAAGHLYAEALKLVFGSKLLVVVDGILGGIPHKVLARHHHWRFSKSDGPNRRGPQGRTLGLIANSRNASAIHSSRALEVESARKWG